MSTLKITWRQFGVESPPLDTTILFYSTKNPASTFGAFGIIKWKEDSTNSGDIQVLRSDRHEWYELDYNDLDYWIPLSELIGRHDIMTEIYGLEQEQSMPYKNDPCYKEWIPK